MENLNKLKLISSLAAIVFCLGVSTTANAAIVLFEYGTNIDGTVTGAKPGDGDPDHPVLGEQGLGTLEFGITGVGAHSFDAFFDHEIDEDVNTYFNEYGSTGGSLAIGQSWEIDEPGYLFGDIFDNFLDSTLDISNGVPAGSEDDVSMALGWDFILAAGEQALITIALSETSPSGGFFLAHSDADSVDANGDPITFYLSSTLEISAIPVPAAIWLFGSGLVGLIGFSRRKAKA